MAEDEEELKQKLQNLINESNGKLLELEKTLLESERLKLETEKRTAEFLDSFRKIEEKYVYPTVQEINNTLEKINNNLSLKIDININSEELRQFILIVLDSKFEINQLKKPYILLEGLTRANKIKIFENNEISDNEYFDIKDFNVNILYTRIYGMLDNYLSKLMQGINK